MAGNSDPIYSRVGAISMRNTNPLGITSYMTSTYDGTNATTDQVVFTADAVNGSYVQRIRFKPLGTNNGSVARIWINNGSAQTVATNNAFYGEMTLPTSASSTSASMVDVDYSLNIALPPGYKILVGVSAAAALASGWVTTVIAGNY